MFMTNVSEKPDFFFVKVSSFYFFSQETGTLPLIFYILTVTNSVSHDDSGCEDGRLISITVKFFF